MKGVRHHVARVRAQPHHVRKRVTVVAAGAIAAVIGAAWFGGSLAAGTFALQPTSYEQAVNADQPTFATTTSDSSNLAGAAAALQEQQNQPAHIVIINAPASTTPAASNSSQTTIPF